MAHEPVEQDLLVWCAQLTGSRVVSAERLVGGNRRRAWAVDTEDACGARRPLFLRFASEPNAPDDPYDLRREARVYRALSGTAVALPQLVGEHPGHAALLLERVAGQSDFRALPDLEREQIAREFMSALHVLHSLEAAALGLGAVPTMRVAVEQELAIWRGMYESTQRADALLEFAFRWLSDHVPDLDQPAVVVHGDAGPGNFLFAQGHLAALVDWELWHFGDPVEDIAWLSMRSVLEPFPAFSQRVREYENLCGAPVERERLLYHRVFVTARVAVIRHRAMTDLSPDSDRGNSLVSRLVNRRLLLECLREATGAGEEPTDLPDPPRSPRTADFDDVLVQLRDVIAPAVSDPIATRRIKSVARVLKHLREEDRCLDAFEQQECEDLHLALREPVRDAAGGRAHLAAAIRARRIHDTAALRYLQRQCARESALGAWALGQLAHRHFDGLED